MASRPFRLNRRRWLQRAGPLSIALGEAVNNPASLVLSANVGDPPGQPGGRLIAPRQPGHCPCSALATKLQPGGARADDKAFPVFASRQEQIAHAFKNLSVMGVKVQDAVCASTRAHAAGHLKAERKLWHC